MSRITYPDSNQVQYARNNPVRLYDRYGLFPNTGEIAGAFVTGAGAVVLEAGTIAAAPAIGTGLIVLGVAFTAYGIYKEFDESSDIADRALEAVNKENQRTKELEENLNKVCQK